MDRRAFIEAAALAALLLCQTEVKASSAEVSEPDRVRQLVEEIIDGRVDLERLQKLDHGYYEVVGSLPTKENPSQRVYGVALVRADKPSEWMSLEIEAMVGCVEFRAAWYGKTVATVIGGLEEGSKHQTVYDGMCCLEIGTQVWASGEDTPWEVVGCVPRTKTDPEYALGIRRISFDKPIPAGTELRLDPW